MEVHHSHHPTHKKKWGEVENIEEQFSKSKPQPQQNVDEIISQKQTIQVKEPQTENMEVYHPHISNLKRNREKVLH
jgi:hypothetical protein